MSAAAERRMGREIAEDAATPEGAVAAYLLGHARDNNIGWTCSCGHKGRLGESYYRHQGDGLVSLMRRRGWLR